MDATSTKHAKATRKRNDKGRRSWSRREEEVLVESLKEIVSSGWKSENGFKIGYLQVLEQEMLKALPGTDLRGIPHINSMIHVWKKDYGSLVSMLSRSGIGWNDNTKMIEARNEAWVDYVKVFEIVGKINGLTLQEKLLVSKLLVKNTEDLELFFSLPDEAKAEFAKMKLAGSL
ncbi:hypothetical protein DH2020_001786 [Rehmannia glutinosa]|uniref:Myb/SANT-like domain-containing protein n=1 Tax=Rehmannia glutinosa TaxID=99300 RepID=A0ABR0XSC7_REHGL